jgi:hypothetical protein
MDKLGPAERPLNPEFNQSQQSLERKSLEDRKNLNVEQNSRPATPSRSPRPVALPIPPSNRPLQTYSSASSLNSYTQAPPPNFQDSNRFSMPPTSYNESSRPPQSNRFSVGPNPFAAQYPSLSQEPVSSYSSLNDPIPNHADYYSTLGSERQNSFGEDLTECALCRHFVEIRVLKMHLDSQCRSFITRYGDVTQKRF